MPSALFIYFFSAIVARPKLLSDPLQWPGRLTEVKAAARRLAVGRLKRWDPNRITQRTAELCPCLPTSPSACLGCVLNLWGQVNWKMEHLVLPTYKMEIIWICHVSSDKEKKERAARRQPSQLDRLPRHTIHTRQARSTTTTSVSSWACRGVGLTTHWTSLKCGWEDSWMCVPITWSRHPLLSVCRSECARLFPVPTHLALSLDINGARPSNKDDRRRRIHLLARISAAEELHHHPTPLPLSCLLLCVKWK